jgi:4-oxalocrotonate tautomerase
MPFINVKLIENVFTPDQKREIVERLTDAMVSIEGENMRSVTWVVVEEVRAAARAERGACRSHHPTTARPQQPRDHLRCRRRGVVIRARC